MRRFATHVHRSEEGHAVAALGSLLAAIGVVLLAVGAASDTDWLTLTGGAGAALGLLAAHVLRHSTIDWEVFRRLDELEKK